MNFSLRTGFVCLGVLAGLGACCTKKDCASVRQPAIIVRYANFVPRTPQPVAVYALNKDNGAPVDSVKLSYFDGTIRLTEGLFGKLGAGDLKDYTYVLITGAGTNDTIRDVSYQDLIYEVPCNNCLLADGSARVQDYKDFQFQHAGRLYQDADTLIIRQ